MAPKFPSWLNLKAFLISAAVTAAQTVNSTTFWGTESYVNLIGATLVGGVFWGWVLTKFLPKYFPRNNQ